MSATNFQCFALAIALTAGNHMNAWESPPHSTMVLDPFVSSKTHFEGLSVTPVASHRRSAGVPTVATSAAAFPSDGLRFAGSVLMDCDAATSAAT